MEKKVDVFIVGAPKCGTTALAHYLNQSQTCYVPPMKEPHFFCTEWPAFRRVKNLKDYHSLYSNAGDKLRVDASVWYLYSNEAAKNIQQYNKDARIIIMLRNPIKASYSLYSQLTYSGRETAATFESAWNLESSRAAGENLPDNCIVPKHLFYSKVYNYPEQIERYIYKFGKSRCKIIIYEEFFADVESGMADVSNFLGLNIDMKAITFDKVNTNRIHRYPRLAHFVMHPPGIIRYVKNLIKQLPFLRGKPLLRPFYRLFSISTKRKMMNERLVSVLENTFVESTHEVARILNRSGSIWQIDE